jgi:DNA-binding response OmpR family regulator
MADIPRRIHGFNSGRHLFALPRLQVLPKSWRRSIHVLVMDESLDLLEFYGDMFRDEGLKVTMTNALMTVDQVGSVRPDLIVMEEVFRHERRGHQLLRDLQSDLQCQAIPVICCTSLDRDQMPMPMNTARIVLKPFDIDELLEAIHAEIEKNPVASA